MSLKSLIQRLLDSRTTPAQAAHSAMPSSSYVTVTATAVQAWGEMAKGVATFDGFVRASARASNTSSNIRVTNDTATVFAQAEGTATGQTQGVFVPVAKGDSWSVYGTNRDNVVVRLVKTIGGGYQTLKKLILQGGVLCRLSRLYSSLRRSSLSVKRSGCSKTLSHLKGTQLLSQINDQVLHLLRILLRQTDCLGFVIKQVMGITLHCLAIATVTEVTQQDGNFLRLTDGQLKTHFMYLKEKSSNLIQTAIRQVLPECGSTRRLNSAVGGASC